MAEQTREQAVVELALPLGWRDLATATHGRLHPPNVWGRSQILCTDSRCLLPGEIYWCLRGERFDGHLFAAEAVARGAALVVCDRQSALEITGPRLVVDDTLAALGQLARWHRKRHEALVIGVTGSVGKTTTKELIALALGQQFHGLKSPGNFNNQIGLPKTLLGLGLDHEFVVCEMGASRRGDIRQLAEIAEPEIGVVTAIGTAHLASFGSQAAIAEEKGDLLAALPSSGFCVLPGDDPATRALAVRANCRVVFAGEGADNDLRAEQIVRQASEVAFRVNGVPMKVALPGPRLLSNVLCAIAVAQEIGVSLELIADGLEGFQPWPGRGGVRKIGHWQVIDDSYNASPKSVEAAIERLAMLPVPAGSRRYAVLGDMRELGESAAREHQRIGEQLAGLGISGVLAFGEHARDLADGAVRGGCKAGTIVATDSLDVLLTMLDCWLNDGDALLIKGSRAMQMERVCDWLQQQAAEQPSKVLAQSA